MDINDDESLKQEVIYLHSLWYQGPPTRNPIPSPNFYANQDPIPRSRQPNYIPPADLQLLSRYGPVSSQIISRNHDYPHNLYNNKRHRPDSSREWPVKEMPRSSPTGSGWPEVHPSKKVRPVPADEKAKFALNKLQRDIHRTCREFFGKKRGEEDSSVADGDGSGSEEGNVDQNSKKEESYSKFLTRSFEENGKLKEYYQKNRENGEFWCLVCGGTGEKSIRKFKSCLALVQHSLNIHKTDLTTQHRALAKVVCNVLGWDVNNPVISSQKEIQTLNIEAVAERPSNSKPPLENPPEKQQIISVDEDAKTAVLQMQQKASESLKDMFIKEDTDSVNEMELITKLFSENIELKNYYKKNYESGNFICLICCSATDKKMIKRFRHCYILLRHCTKAAKLKTQAHKAFARFVSELLGWDIDRLPRRATNRGASLIESKPNQKPSSAIEDDMCEDKAENSQDNIDESR